MQQRQLRLGDILDDYCPRERRVTNHAVVAMIGAEVKQTRCTTCEAEHEYKQAKMPRLRRKTQSPAALAAQGLAGAPKLHEPDAQGRPADDAPLPAGAESPDDLEITGTLEADEETIALVANPAEDAERDANDAGDVGRDEGDDRGRDEGPVHRPLIRASLPRPEGTPPPARPATDFTIRQPTGRQNRFRPRQQQGGPFQSNRGNGNFGASGRGGGGSRPGGGRPPQGGMPRNQRRHDSGRKRSR
jgi:uncharacterized membrane protein YgcG